MKRHYVYEIVNLMGTVEYVGETINPKNRFKLHKLNCTSPGSGKFKNRSDVFMNIVCEFNSKKEAFDYQCILQSECGIETDREKLIKNGKINYFKKGRVVSNSIKTKISLANKGKVRSDEAKLKYSLAKKLKNNGNQFYTCPHCNKIGQSSSMFRWHFDNCKHK